MGRTESDTIPDDTPRYHVHNCALMCVSFTNIYEQIIPRRTIFINLNRKRFL